MLDLNSFIFFPDGTIEIGINFSDIENIITSVKNVKIKKEYLTASSPSKKISYNHFHIKKSLVTVNDFKKFIEQTSYITESEREGWGWVWNNKWAKEKNVSWRNPFGNELNSYFDRCEDTLPVMQVSWNDAVEYTKWLSQINGRTVRLPLEYEWEILGNYAGLDSLKDYLSEENRKIKSDEDFLKLLCQNLEKTEFQLGLLWEWTADWYQGYDQKVINNDFGEIYKILRGGSLLSEQIQKSKEFRFRRCPTARSPYYGFRIVIDNQDFSC